MPLSLSMSNVKSIRDIFRSDYDLFIKKIKLSNSGCWNWTASVSNLGYGVCSYNGGQAAAHRFSYVYFNGEIPDGMDVLHSCDNASCVNPSHLSVGTHQQNMIDRAVRLRGAKKLNPELVRQIRNSNESQRKIAKSYGVTQALIWRIKTERIWKHV